jgi:hypothetical protein
MIRKGNIIYFYRREYNAEYMVKHNEDLSTLGFRAFMRSLHHYTALTSFPGRSVLGSQLRLRYRRRVQPPARFHRMVRSLPSRNPPEPQPIHCSRRNLHPSASVEWSPRRDRHDLKPSIRESADVAVGRVRRNGGQTVSEPTPSA